MAANSSIIQRLAVALGLDPTEFEAGVKRANASMDKLNDGSKEATKQQQALGRGFQNIAFQAQDAAVQIGGGTDAIKVLAQQAPQALVGFGALGAAIGVALSLLPFFIKSTETSAENIERLKNVSSEYQQVSNELQKDIRSLTFAYGENADEVERLLRAKQGLLKLEETSRYNKLVSDTTSAIEKQTTVVTNFTSAVGDLGVEFTGASHSVEVTERNFANLASTFKITQDQANKLGPLLEKVANAKTPKERAAAITAFLDALKALGITMDTTTEEGKKFLKLILELADATQNQLKVATDAAAAAAKTLAENISNAADNYKRLIKELTTGVPETEVEKLERRFKPGGDLEKASAADKKRLLDLARRTDEERKLAKFRKDEHEEQLRRLTEAEAVEERNFQAGRKREEDEAKRRRARAEEIERAILDAEVKRLGEAESVEERNFQAERRREEDRARAIASKLIGIEKEIEGNKELFKYVLDPQRLQLEKDVLEFRRQNVGVTDEQVEAFRRLRETQLEQTAALNLVQQKVSSVFSNMESAIDRFVETGKLDFKSFASSVIRDLIKIELKAQATSLLRGVLRGFGSIGFGTGVGFGSEDIGQYLADGGNVKAGVPVTVGERGRETFIPATDGKILNNTQTNSLGMGGGTQIYNVNVSAIDTQSGVEFVMKNRQAIWAGWQSQNKSTQIGRGRV